MTSPESPDAGVPPTRRSLREAEAAAARAEAEAAERSGAASSHGAAPEAGGAAEPELTVGGGPETAAPDSDLLEVGASEAEVATDAEDTGPLGFFTQAAKVDDTSSAADLDKTDSKDAAESKGSPKPRKRRKVSIVGVLGELLLTAGVLVLLFIGWQIWWHTAVVSSSQNSAGQDLSRQFSELPEPTTPLEPDDEGSYGDPVIGTAPTVDGESFGVLWVPRFGDDWSRVIAQGTSREAVLDHPELGVGHYDGTAMPAEVGNFAIAAHRDGWGNTFEHINQLQLGDEVVVETEEGWYTYVFRNLEYVQPTGVGVLYPVPQMPEFAAQDRILTMTSCNPLYTAAERIIAYAVFDSWQPRSAGPPASIAAEVAAADSAAEGGK